MIWTGWLLCIVGLVASSFADTIGALIATQGIMYGIGFVSLYFPIVIMVNEWWIARRGMAFGIIVSASGASGAVVPFAVEALLDKYGYKTTLRAVAVAITVLTGPLIPLFRNRLPPAEQSAMAKTSWSVLKKPLFWIYCVSTVLQGLGFFFPSLFLPSYASSIGLDATQGALLLAVMAFAQVLGQFVFGYLSDNRVSINLLAGVSSITAAIASVAIWGRAKSLAGLIVFGLVYGIFGYGYASTRVGMVNAVIDDPAAAPTTFSIFIFSQGVGNVLAGPISAGLLSPSTRRESYGILRYKAVVIFSGACMFLSALTIGSWFLGPGRRRVV
jgi:MFS family permease